MYVYSHILCAPLHTLRCKGTTIFWNVQDFKQKKCSLCLLKHNFLLKRLSFAHKCERIFGGLGVPVQRGNRNTGRGFNFLVGGPKVLQFFFTKKQKKSTYLIVLIC